MPFDNLSYCNRSAVAQLPGPPCSKINGLYGQLAAGDSNWRQSAGYNACPATLKGLLRRPRPGIAFNRHFEGDGTVVYKQACALGCEGIVSKRLISPYRSGRADCWIKIKNPAAPAAKRIDEEDWSK